MDTAIKLRNLIWYIKRGWPLFPCGADKRPLTQHGFKDASLDIEVIRNWHEKFPEANWAIPTGPVQEGGAGLVVLDLDCHPGKPNGIEAFEQLREEHSDPIETVTVRTGGGGRQIYFEYPDGHAVKSATDVLAPGIDVRARGGYVLVPPSQTQRPYVFEFNPGDTPIQKVPQWILSRVNGQMMPTLESPQAKIIIEQMGNREPDLAIANSALNALKTKRADDYQMWLEVGMSLFCLGDDGLIAWDNWSQKSEKYDRGTCAQKWKSFSRELTDASKITFGSLIYWAEEDGVQPFIRRAPKKAKPSDYAKVLDAFGFQFSLNDMNDMIYINGHRMSDVLMSSIEYRLRDFEYRSEKDTQVAVYKLASDNKFHPIKDYLTGLIRQGMNTDYISQLAGYFEDKDGVFPLLLRKWLIGAVGRVLGSRPGQQHPMLVLDGPQGIGKSRFTWWLGSPLPAFYLQSSINPNDKDFLILLCSKFVWEVEELGATLRKSDIESLKAFLSKEIVNVRKPYGRDEIVKPSTASFIGTINNSGGFLADPTGSWRFRVCTLTKINWAYEQEVDVNQVWAQAVALFEEGETHNLEPDQQKRMLEINGKYDIDDPLLFDLVDTFNVQPEDADHNTATAEIIHKLRDGGKIVGGNDNLLNQRIANILTKLGCEKIKTRINGHQVRAWRGVWPRLSD